MTTGLAEWLEARGLGRYARVFADNDIDLDVLVDLSDADFERLGVSLGHRRKLLRALAARRQPSVRQLPGAVIRDPVADEPHEAERRQVTVMFCDLVGSTELASVLDPEDMAALIRHFQEASTRAIASFDGFVAKFMGDGILAYFGYPQASEHAAERAVLAALEMVGAIGRLARPDDRPLESRIGIATRVCSQLGGRPRTAVAGRCSCWASPASGNRGSST